MKSTVIIFAIIGAVLCHRGFDGFGGSEGQERSGGRGGSEGRGGRGHGGRGGRGHHPHGPPPPPYLRNVTDDARKEFFDIRRNDNLTIAQQKEKINEWGAKYNILDQVQEFDKNMTKFKNEVKQNVTKLIGQLSVALEKMSAILDDEDQTPKEMFSAIRNLTEQDPPLYHVLRFANDQFMKRRGPRGGRGGKGGPHGPGGPSRFGDPDGPAGPFGGSEQGFGQGMGGGPGGMGGRGGMGGQGGMGGPGGMNEFQGGRNQFGRNNGFRF
ncbi:hypothetical protein OESDEN_05565 [Oesophagostomum dentatum]|uniref:SXP/RAL-2 family protein Ani s 5-like cation-binding domain-containing protein n=1 Tax=Oesophagostomum dentatum TaxID=61180 RepID=A0A0B1TB66_OESDE|nr:hypothetical protein OESDEN_05565 [Oesophagostomum dentatum]